MPKANLKRLVLNLFSKLAMSETAHKVGCTMSHRWQAHFPARILYIKRQSLWVILKRTGSHCKWMRHGITCACLPRLKMILAAAFWTRWSGSTVDRGRDAKTD